ncbi:MAG: hypothetical protein K2X93_20460 [Candidatus Obscuribacterales bacterium]|nr:hypothetical protein [Candidatus Obscuribacterales bacterium]
MPTKQDLSAEYLESQLCFDGKRFFPVGINLEGKRILFVGSGADMNQQIQGVIEFGALVDVIAEQVTPELKSLGVTYSHRVKLLETKISDLIEKKIDLASSYFMVFAYSKNNEHNTRISALAREAGVLSTELVLKEDDDFALSTWFRRGQIKISVATDGISGALERALINRIKASFVREMDHYALFADFVVEKLTDARHELKDEVALSEIVRSLIYSEDISLALQRNNFDEASQLFDQHLKHKVGEKKQDV